MENTTTTKGFIASVLAVISFIGGTFGILFVILIILMTIDYLTGLSSSIIHNQQKSRIGIIGIIKKIGYVFLIVTASLFDMAIIQATNDMGINLGMLNLFGTIVTCWLISNEILSIIENLGKLGVPTPRFFETGIGIFKEKIEKIADKNKE